MAVVGRSGLRSLGHARWLQGKTDLSLEALPTIERIAERDQDPLQLAWARFQRALAYQATDLAGVGSFADDAVRDAEASGNPHQPAFAYLASIHRSGRELRVV